MNNSCARHRLVHTIMTKDGIRGYLVCNTEYTDEQVERMTPFQLVDAYLTDNGIIGYTTDIVDVVLHAFGFLADNQDVDDLIY